MPAGAPHVPQNLVVAVIGVPQALQTIAAGPGRFAGAAATAVAPQTPQNFSLPERGLPQDAQA